MADYREYLNDPAKAGQLAARKVLFGEYNRYAVAPVYTRFDAVQWFVWDAEKYDETGSSPSIPSVIRQEATLELAVQGLEL